MAGQQSSFTYDVFLLSFCGGSDTGHGTFTENLVRAFHGRGINRTFIVEDEELLPRDDKEVPELLKAIEQSKIAVIVFSNNYTSTSLRLEALACIVDSFQQNNHQFILPVYYVVDPSEVLARLEEEEMLLLKDKKEDKVQKWRNALCHVANLPCWHFKLGTGCDEFGFLERIVEEVCNGAPLHADADEVDSNIGRVDVEEVSNRAPLPVVDSPVRIGYDEVESNGKRIVKEVPDRASLHDGDYLVGLEPRMEEVCSLMELESDGVLMVGIWGMGGMGKTTLAQAVYKRITHQFEGSCFLHNVREDSNTPDGLVRLQNMLLSETSGEKDIQLRNVNEGVSMIKLRLRLKKVLLVLDEVDGLEQLKALVGGLDWFGSGSRVIITTRDKHLVHLHGAEKLYLIQPLNDNDALELLSRKAFKDGIVDPSYTDILKQVVTYASGLPLALEVIGSFLFGKTVDEWRDALDRFERIPDREIQKILKVNFDDLEEDLQSVFLDISCCFKGYELAMLQDILFAHYGQRMDYHIQVLIDKSLISISSDSKVTLHPLLEDMGKEIVRQESPEEPGERSRLWFYEDVVHVLTRKTGTSNIEIIHLDYPLTEDEEVIEWDGEAFKKMQNLITLIVKKCHFSKAAKHLPNSLRVLEWWRYPSHELPSDFHPKQLKIRELPDMGFGSPRQAELLQSVSEVSPTSQSVPGVSQSSTRVVGIMLQSSHTVLEVSHTSQSVPEVLETSTWVARVKFFILQRDFQAEMVWRLVGLVSSVVGMSCQAKSPCFKRLIRGWNPFKFFLYGVLSLVICATILFAKPSSFSVQHKNYICLVVFMIISVYSFLYDRAVDGKPEILSLVSNIVSAMLSLSLSKLVKFGFETGTFLYFLGCFTIQLLTIDWKLILVAIIVDCPLFLWHFSSDSQPEIDHRGQTIPLWTPNN